MQKMTEANEGMGAGGMDALDHVIYGLKKHPDSYNALAEAGIEYELYEMPR